MEEEKLKKYISIVFQKEDNDLTHEKLTWFLENGTIKYINSESLVNVYSNILGNDKLIKVFVNLLEHQISSGSDIHLGDKMFTGLSAVSFYTLLKIGYTEKALIALNKRLNSTFLMIKLIHDIIGDKNNYFTVDEIDLLFDCLRKIRIHSQGQAFFDAVYTKIIDQRFEIMNKEVFGVNVEINMDKKSLQEKINKYNLDEKYVGLLDELDQYLNTSSSPYISSAMIGNLRVFMQDLFIDLANKLKEKFKEEIPKTTKTDIGDARLYIKHKLELSDNDHSFINKFIDILHKEGGHSFTSNKEYFRLARNIGIEIALLVMSRFESVYGK